MAIRYIGSKTRIVDAIMDVVGSPRRRGDVFVDAFCGTGAVAEAAARRGWSIRLNDHLAAAVTIARARLLAPADVPFTQLGGYAAAVRQLNAARPTEGFIFREYSPTSKTHAGVARMYFTESNAARIDGAREQVRAWRTAGAVTAIEEQLLLADLVLAANSVANIAGTYGCFLSHWSPVALNPLLVRQRELFSRPVQVEATIGDVYDVDSSPDAVVYLDPPYTKRQYAAYYHILETIVAGDEPVVGGITGLRPWADRASDFCYRKRALAALIRLVRSQASRRLFLSYSVEGHVPLDALRTALASVGRVSTIEVQDVARYRPNRAARSAGDAVTEYLLVVERAKQTDRQTAFA